MFLRLLTINQFLYLFVSMFVEFNNDSINNLMVQSYGRFLSRVYLVGNKYEYIYLLTTIQMSYKLLITL